MGAPLVRQTPDSITLDEESFNRLVELQSMGRAQLGGRSYFVVTEACTPSSSGRGRAAVRFLFAVDVPAQYPFMFPKPVRNKWLPLNYIQWRLFLQEQEGIKGIHLTSRIEGALCWTGLFGRDLTQRIEVVHSNSTRWSALQLDKPNAVVAIRINDKSFKDLEVWEDRSPQADLSNRRSMSLERAQVPASAA
jgi:hypothetical protein